MRTNKIGVIYTCIFVGVFCVNSVLAEEKAPLPDPNLNFEVKELTIPASMASNNRRQNTPPYAVLLRFKYERQELWVNINSPDGGKILENVSEETSRYRQSGYNALVSAEKNEDNTCTVTLRAGSEQDAKIMAANTLRLIQDKGNRTLKQMQESIAFLKSRIEKWPDEINTSKKEKEQLETKIEGGKKTDWAVMSDAELQAFILELKKAVLITNCEVVGAEKKYNILKEKEDRRHPETADSLTANLIAAEAEVEGFKAKKQATTDLLNTIERFLADKSRMEFLAKDIPAKEDQLKRTPEYLKQREQQLAEMKPIELAENVIRIEHYLIAQ